MNDRYVVAQIDELKLSVREQEDILDVMRQSGHCSPKRFGVHLLLWDQAQRSVIGPGQVGWQGEFSLSTLYSTMRLLNRQWRECIAVLRALREDVDQRTMEWPTMVPLDDQRAS